MRFEVPQFIEVEDKIFGPFTWKQFIYLAGGAGIALVTFLTLPLFLFALIGIPIAALAGFLAFHQVNKRPFSVFLESFVTYFANSKLYLWKKTHEQTVKAPVTHTLAPEKKAQPPAGRDKISILSRNLTLTTLESEHPNNTSSDHA